MIRSEPLEVIETGVPPNLIGAMIGAELIEIPSAAELVVMQKQRALSQITILDLYRTAVAILAKTPENRHAEESKVWRSAISSAELGHVPPLPAGVRALALLALETIANATWCWNMSVKGDPLCTHPGKVFTQPGGIGKRLKVFWPNGKSPVGAPARLLIWLDCGVTMWVPSWFLEARHLPYPFDSKAVSECKHSASLALREYLWQMLEWNLRDEFFGKPVGGRGIEEDLRYVADEERRAPGDTKARNRGDKVEQLHKNAFRELSRIATIIPERFPFHLFQRHPATGR